MWNENAQFGIGKFFNEYFFCFRYVYSALVPCSFDSCSISKFNNNRIKIALCWNSAVKIKLLNAQWHRHFGETKNKMPLVSFVYNFKMAMFDIFQITVIRIIDNPQLLPLFVLTISHSFKNHFIFKEFFGINNKNVFVAVKLL